MRISSSLFSLGSAALASVVALVACGSDSGSGASSDAGSGGAAPSSGSASDSGGLGGSMQSAGNAVGGDGAGTPSTGSSNACVATTAQASLEPVHLFFIMDESGSMGDGEHGIAAEKWDPVVAALKAFYADPLSQGLHATMTLFPPNVNKTTGPAENSYLTQEQCVGSTYSKPDVSMTPLPDSTSFAGMLDAISPPNEYGTPTRPAVEGMIQQVDAFLASSPAANVAMVLVTDGEPAFCDGNTIASTSSAIASVAARYPTYVIGVGESLDSLNQLAASGGTGAAFLVKVGNAAQTQTDFLTAINTVRGALVPCEVTIPPPPPGETLDPSAVNVDVVSGNARTPLGYNQTCTGGSGWRYDDPAAPKKILFCDTTCGEVKNTPGAKVEVAFGCEQRVEIPK